MNNKIHEIQFTEKAPFPIKNPHKLSQNTAIFHIKKVQQLISDQTMVKALRPPK